MKKPQTPSIGPVIDALESAWRSIRAHHHELPNAVITVGQGSDPRRRGTLRAGHWWERRWHEADGQDPKIAEVFIAGERLGHGAEKVFGTLLHEAAHGIASERGVQDTDKRGRYHNQNYAAIARECLLDVQQNEKARVHGWNVTSLTDEASERYSADITAIATAITGFRRTETGRRRRTAKPTRVSIECGCGRKLMGAPGTVAEGPILCGVCGKPFLTEEERATGFAPRIWEFTTTEGLRNIARIDDDGVVRCWHRGREWCGVTKRVADQALAERPAVGAVTWVTLMNNWKARHLVIPGAHKTLCSRGGSGWNPADLSVDACKVCQRAAKKMNLKA